MLLFVARFHEVGQPKHMEVSTRSTLSFMDRLDGLSDRDPLSEDEDETNDDIQ